FWSTVVAKTINGEAQIYTKVDGKKVIISEASIRRDLQFVDEEGVDCLPNSTIFEQLASIGLLNHERKYVSSSHTKKIFGNMRRIKKGFSWRITPLFPTMIVQSQLGKGSAMFTDPHHTPTILQASLSQPQKTHKPRKPKRKNTQVPQPSGSTEHVADEAVYKELGDSLVRTAITASSLEAEQDSGNIDKTQCKATPNESSSQWTDSGGPRKVKKLERRNKSRTYKLKRLYKVRLTVRVESLDNEESLADAEMFDANKDLGGEEVFVEQEVITNKEKIDEVTLAQALADLKTSKPKAKGVVIQEPSESPTTTTIPKQKSQEKGKRIMIDADYQLAERLQAEEQQELNDEEKATMFIAFKRVNTFEPIRSELVQGKEKRVGEELVQESLKKQKVDDDKEIAELNHLFDIIQDKEEVAIDAIPLAVKSPGIVDRKIYKERKKSYYQIIRADGKSKMYMFFSQMLTSFDREDLEDLYKFIKAKYGSTRPVKDLDLLLWGDLKTMFKPHIEDAVWRKQQGYKVLEWNLYNSYGVHSLRMQSMQVFMLAEKIYPLIPSTLSMMLEKKLKTNYQSEMAYQLLELIIVTPPNWVATEYWVRGVLLHRSVTQDIY
nr:hypothetical protein [Tanacetum cinerariifolium]